MTTRLADIEKTLNKLHDDILKLTSERQEFYKLQNVYLDSYGAKCPVCENTRHETRVVSVSDNQINVAFVCKNCKSEWVGGFEPTKLVAVSPRFEGPHKTDEF